MLEALGTADGNLAGELLMQVTGIYPSKKTVKNANCGLLIPA
jgi:hypothetical protein